MVALTIAVPGLEAVNFPVEDQQFLLSSLLLDQVTDAVNASPYWSFGVSSECEVISHEQGFWVGETSIEFRNGGTLSTVTIAVPVTEPLVALTIAVPGLKQ